MSLDGRGGEVPISGPSPLGGKDQTDQHLHPRIEEDANALSKAGHAQACPGHDGWDVRPEIRDTHTLSLSSQTTKAILENKLWAAAVGGRALRIVSKSAGTTCVIQPSQTDPIGQLDSVWIRS